MKQFTVKETNGFRLRVKSWKCSGANKDLNAMEFIQESLDSKGAVIQDSTYQFFMTDKEVKTLVKGLIDV